MLKIQTKVRTKTITNKDEVFKDTDFSEVEFSVDVKELKYDELMSIEVLTCTLLHTLKPA